MKEGLQILTQNQLVILTKPQQGLLNLINEAVLSKKTLSMDDIVLCYYNNVRKSYEHPWPHVDFDKEKVYDVMKEYKKQSFTWTYRLRSLVKGWFINTIGTLVLKGKLIVLPIIEIE